MHHVHANFGAQLVNLWHTLLGHPDPELAGDIHTADEDVGGRPFFVIPDVRLTIAQRVQLTETGFNQGMPFALSADGMSRPELSSVKIRPLVSLCSLDPGSVKLVRVISHAHLPAHAKSLPKTQRAELITARREGKPEYELQFTYSADCDVYLTCFFGAFASKDLSQIKIRVDLPGSKRWEATRLPQGRSLPFKSSEHGLTLIEQDPVFYRLLRLTTRLGPAKQVLEESLRSGIYDAIVTLVPAVEDLPALTRTHAQAHALAPRPGEETGGGGAIAKYSGDIEMADLHGGESSRLDDSPGVGTGRDNSNTKTGEQAGAGGVLAELLQGKEAVSAEYTLCQLLVLPDLRPLPSKQEQEPPLFSSRSPSRGAEKADGGEEEEKEGRGGEAMAIRAAEAMGLEGLEGRLSEHNKKSLPSRNGSPLAIAGTRVVGAGAVKLKKVILDISHPDLDHEEGEGEGEGEEEGEREGEGEGLAASQSVPLQAMSQRVQWNQQYFHIHEVFGGDWSWYQRRATGSAGKTESGDDGDGDRLCVICLGAPKEVVCIPCRHLCICGDCSMILKDQQTAAINQHRGNARVQPGELLKCPMCRARVSVLVHIRKSQEEED